MALSEAEYDRLEAAIADGGLDPAYAAKARELLAERKTAGPASVTPAPDNSLGVTGVINQPGAAPAPDDSEVGRIASALDPRFDLIPQGLALLPATNDSRGVEGYKAGTTGPVKFAYEPPVAVVRKQLLENPNMLRLLRSDPPSPEEIEAMDSDSPIYKDASNYMWSRTMEAAQKGGYTVYRYSQLPWGNEDWSFQNLGLKLQGAGQSLMDAERAYVMGVDDTATLGAARAATEAIGPEQKLPVPGNTDIMGVDEQVPQKVAEANDWAIEDNPLAYTLGQGTGAIVGAPELVYRGILAGGEKLVAAIAKTRFGALASKAPALVKGAAGLAGEVAAGTGEAAVTQTGQELVDQASPRRGSVLEAGERILDTGESALGWGLGGSVLSRLGGLGADAIRHSDRLGGGAVGRAEKNLSWGPAAVPFGPGLKGDVKGMVRRANIEENAPGDYIAERIAPPIKKAAQAEADVTAARSEAVRRHHYQSAEGQAAEPVKQLHEQSIERLRDHYQPEPGGQQRAVDDKWREAHKVFNSVTGDVSLAPLKGASKLTPDEAGAFLSLAQRRKLISDDIEAAVERRQATPDDRKAYLGTVDPKKRAAVNEEIQASIDDRLQQTAKGDRALDIDQRSAEYKAIEQEVLRERVDEDMVLEPFKGSFAEYLKQRGKDSVYVTPRALDARRTDTLIKGLNDEGLAGAAKLDRKGRSAGGQRGGYSRMLDQQDEAAAKAKDVVESIAPKGDAFRAVAHHGRKPKLGDKQDADVMRALADKAGVRPDLNLLRSLQDTLGVQHLSHGRTMTGKTRGLFDANRWIDSGTLSAFPVLRALEPGGALSGGHMSRAALLGQIEDEKARADEVERGKPGYEKRRAALQKEKDAERDKAKKERERRRTEKHRDD